MLSPTLFTALAIGVASAQASDVHQMHHRRNLNTLLARQTTTVSSACENTVCATFQTTLTNCKTLSCLCTSSVAASLQSCVDCALNADRSAKTIETVHLLADAYEDSCTGYNLPSINIDAGTSSSSAASAGTTAAASGTNNAAGAASATAVTGNLVAGSATASSSTTSSSADATPLLGSDSSRSAVLGKGVLVLAAAVAGFAFVL